ALDKATEKLLQNNKSPSPKVREMDNRGSHFYLAMYWAEAMATQTTDAELRSRFAPLAASLAANEKKIVDELNAVQGRPVDMGGYCASDSEMTAKAMRPGATFNAVLTS